MDFPEELMIMQAKGLRKAIREFKASKESPELIRLK